jgi:hypothetical protein
MPMTKNVSIFSAFEVFEIYLEKVLWFWIEIIKFLKSYYIGA